MAHDEPIQRLLRIALVAVGLAIIVAGSVIVYLHYAAVP